MQLSMQEKLDFIKNKVELAPFTTYGIGGIAEFFAIVHSKNQLINCLKFCTDNLIPYFILGKGSNVLFHDKGYRGMVIVNRIDYYKQIGHQFIVSSGFSFTRLGQLSAKLGYGGLEFASGIPGSVGGAIYMNAGAQGSETKDTLQEVICFANGKELVLQKEQMQFGYRFSNFQQEKQVILEASFLLSLQDGARVKQKTFLAQRMASQPYTEKTCGSVFQNPYPFFAGKLIEDANLKGMTIGKATVSCKHANFIVNSGGATAADVVALIAFIKEAVYKKTKVMLQEEVKLVPYE